MLKVKLKVGNLLCDKGNVRRLTFEYLLKSIPNRIGKKATFENCWNQQNSLEAENLAKYSNDGQNTSWRIDRAWICAQNFGALRYWKILRMPEGLKDWDQHFKKNQRLLCQKFPVWTLPRSWQNRLEAENLHFVT